MAWNYHIQVDIGQKIRPKYVSAFVRKLIPSFYKQQLPYIGAKSPVCPCFIPQESEPTHTNPLSSIHIYQLHTSCISHYIPLYHTIPPLCPNCIHLWLVQSVQPGTLLQSGPGFSRCIRMPGFRQLESVQKNCGIAAWLAGKSIIYRCREYIDI